MPFMVFKVQTLKKVKIIQKSKDQILWEDFVAKNNIKKKFRAILELNQAT